MFSYSQTSVDFFLTSSQLIQIKPLIIGGDGWEYFFLVLTGVVTLTGVTTPGSQQAILSKGLWRQVDKGEK